MECNSCGAQIKAEDRFCSFCGKQREIKTEQKYSVDYISLRYKEPNKTLYRLFFENRVVSGLYKGEVIIALENYVYLAERRIGFSKETVDFVELKESKENINENIIEENVRNEDERDENNELVEVEIFWKTGESSTIKILSVIYEKLLLSLKNESIDFNEIIMREDETVSRGVRNLIISQKPTVMFGGTQEEIDLSDESFFRNLSATYLILAVFIFYLL